MYELKFLTNTGLKREHNEDSILINDYLICNTSLDNEETIKTKEIRILCVADGMGGHDKGEVASCLVLEYLKNKNFENKENFINTLKSALIELNKISPDKKAGTVIAGIVKIKEDFYVFNVGDCRVYGILFGYLTQLTKDHSLVYNLYQNGEITYEEINTHPQKNIVTSALVSDSKNFEIYIKKIDINEFDGYVICSDGVWEMLDSKEFEECLKTDSINCIKEKVYQNGADDNLSIIYVRKIDE